MQVIFGIPLRFHLAFCYMSGMSRNRFEALNCSVARSLDEVGDWWTLLIVRDTARGIDSFDGFQSALGIASNILSARLVRLVKRGILLRLPDEEDGRRVRYRLTPKGKALLPVIISLMQWGDEWLSGRGREPVIVQHAGTGEKLAPVSVRTPSGVVVTADEVRFAPGPGTDSHRRPGRRSRRQ
jgi:DNA-binding HxlR family transcriptional regulator